MPNFETVLLEYQDKLRGLDAGLSQAEAKQSGALALTAVGLAVFFLLCIAAYSSRRAAPAHGHVTITRDSNDRPFCY